MTPTQSGESREARGVTETLRQNAFHYDVPVSGIDQLLYTWMPDLIFSPPPLQRIARAQFRNMLAFGAILVSALIAVFGVSHPGQRWLVFMLYCVLGAWILDPRAAQGRRLHRAQRARAHRAWPWPP